MQLIHLECKILRWKTEMCIIQKTANLYTIPNF